LRLLFQDKKPPEEKDARKTLFYLLHMYQHYEKVLKSKNSLIKKKDAEEVLKFLEQFLNIVGFSCNGMEFYNKWHNNDIKINILLEDDSLKKKSLPL